MPVSKPGPTPSPTVDLDALERTLALFPTEMRVAVEPRHVSWWVPGLAGVLRAHGSALVEADRKGPLGPEWITAPWRYVRFHVGRAHPEPCYGREALDHWARRLAGAEEAYVYFNNDPRGCALRDARRFALAAARHGLDPTRVAPASLTRVEG